VPPDHRREVEVGCLALQDIFSTFIVNTDIKTLNYLHEHIIIQMFTRSGLKAIFLTKWTLSIVNIVILLTDWRNFLETNLSKASVNSNYITEQCFSILFLAPWIK